MIDQKYGERMRTFIDSLPNTNVLMVYFISPKVRIAENLHVLSTSNGHVFINRGPVGLWVFTYLPSAIQYLFTRVDTDVQAFVGTIYGGANFDIGNVGSHLTVGIKEKTGRLMLNTHFTFYEENISKQFEFSDDRSTECTVWLDEPLDDQSRCLSNKGHSTEKSFGSVYKDYPMLPRIIHILRSVFLGDLAIHKGVKGGRYLVNNGSKKYLRPIVQPTKGGGLQLTDDIIEMIYQNVIRPVDNICSSEYNYAIYPSLLYDTDNMFMCRTQHIILIYDIPHIRIRHIFYLDAANTFNAYEAYKFDQAQANSHATVNPPITVAPPSQHARTCINQFKIMVKMQANAMVA